MDLTNECTDMWALACTAGIHELLFYNLVYNLKTEYLK